MRGNVQHHQVSGMIVASLIMATFCCGFVLTSSFVSADDSYNADVTLSIPVACTMTGTINTPHTANVESGTYVADIGTTTLKAVCNDANGFSIYAIGYSNQEYGNNKMLATVGGTLAPTYDITTGTAQNGNTSNWAMKLNAVAGTYAPTILSDFDSYHPVPDPYTKVATRTAGTDATVGANLQSTYAVYVTSTQPAGSYNGKVKYTMVYPNDADSPLQPQTTQAGQICYYPNGSNVEGTMGCQTIPESGIVDDVSPTSAVLLASNFSREGYGFAGWSKTFDYSDTTGFLGPQETITFTAGEYTGSNPGLSLYARWIKSAGSLQNWSGCSSLQSGAVTALTDQRDNETYAVAKLADGKCWMIENLRLDNSATLTTINTNNPLNDGTNVTLKHNYADTETYNTLSAPQDPTATAWCKSIGASCYDQSMLFTGNTTNRASSPTVNGVAMYSYGNYYNWYSATAGRGTYSFGTNNNSVAGDLCPAGWHLPKGGNKSNEANNEFWSLVVTGINGGTNPANYESDTTPYYTGTAEAGPVADKLRSYPNNFVYSGSVNGGSVDARGSRSSFWSSTALSPNSASILLLHSSGVYPGAGNGVKYHGWTVRCVVSGV